MARPVVNKTNTHDSRGRPRRAKWITHQQQALIDKADTTTRCQWWCELNNYNWPAAFGAEPHEWQYQSLHDRNEYSRAVALWTALFMLVPYRTLRAAWDARSNKVRRAA